MKTNFSDNLQYYRRLMGLTQEELAERLEVSRQAVGKWESGGAYPETDKLITLSELFGCSVDALLKGEPPRVPAEPEAAAEPPPPPPFEETTPAWQLFQAYDAQRDRFSLAIAGGVALILLGIFALLFFCQWNEAMAVAPMLALVAAACFLILYYSLEAGAFRRQYPYVPDLYTLEEKQDFQRRFAMGIAAAVALIILAVAIMVFLYSIQWANEYLPVALFFLLLAVAVFLLVWLGIQQAKYNLNAYNKNQPPPAGMVWPQGQPAPACGQPAARSGSDDLSGKIMLSATGIFLIAGFLFHLWHPAWIVFPLGGILCGILSRDSED